MMRGRALRLGPEGVTGLGQTGRTFSRTGCCDMATLKPMTPLQPLMQASMKPPSPMLTPEQQPLKPPSPLQPKTRQNARFSPAKALAVSTPGTYERAKAMAVSRESFPILEGHDGAGQHTFACNSPEETSCVSLSSLKFQALLGVADYRHQGIACEIAKQ